MADTPNFYQDGTPKVDAHGRNIVRVAADNEQGFRYMHEDSMTKEDKLYTGKLPDDSEETQAVTVKYTKKNASNIAPGGEHVGHPTPAPDSNLNLENNPNAAWGNPDDKVIEGVIATPVEGSVTI